MDCREFRNTFSDFVDGELDGDVEALVHAHLAQCEPCRRHEAAYRAGLDALREAELPCVSRDFGARIVHRVRREPCLPAMASAHGIAGALLVGVLVALVAFDVFEEQGDRPAARRSEQASLPLASAGATSPAAPQASGESLPDSATSAAAVDGAYDLITVRAGYPRFGPPYFEVPASTRVPAQRVRFEVPAVWSGR